MEDSRLAQADAIGLNFYAQSPRYVMPKQACQIASAARPGCDKVGVFVNSTAAEINAIAKQVGLTWIQLHGDEPPELVSQIDPKLPVVRAYRLGDHPLDIVTEDIEACRAGGRAPDAVLVDASLPGVYGGTGERLDWRRLEKWRLLLKEMPLILAGGLNATNVGEAIRQVQPTAVDTASGVEQAPGRKDANKMQSFFHAATAAFAEIAHGK